MTDWYEAMIEYESVRGEKYGIDVKGGLIEIWRFGDYKTVARFTAEQATVFFEGLRMHGETEKDYNMLNINVNYLCNLMDKHNVPYEPAMQDMSLKEKYCYCARFAERYKLVEEQAN